MTPRPNDDRPPGATATEHPDDAVAKLIESAGPRPSVPAERLLAIRQRIDQKLAPADQGAFPSTTSTSWPTWLRAAAALLVILVATWAVLELRKTANAVGSVTALAGSAELVGSSASMPLELGSSVDTGDTLRAISDTSLSLGGTRQIRLRAGTVVRWLDPHVIELEGGSLYIDSEDSLGRAEVPGVVVATLHGNVREIGTQFLVELDERGLRVHVRRGLVELSTASDAATIEPGSVASTTGDFIEQQLSSPLARDWQWIESLAPPFDMDGRSFAEYRRWYEREVGRQLLLDEGIGPRDSQDTVRLSGSLEGLAPRSTVDVVAASMGFAVEQRDGATVLVLPD